MAGVAATRRKGRGKGRKERPDGGGHGREGGTEKKLRSLTDLPQNWWTPVPQDKGGYQMLTHTWLMGRK
eukprot:1431924-Alexandrium_andersonii.AAC.1